MKQQESLRPYEKSFAAWLGQFILSENHEAMWKFADEVWNAKPEQVVSTPNNVSQRHLDDAAQLLMAIKTGYDGATARISTAAAPTPTSALAVQQGGSHYKDKAIQPVEYIHANGLGFLEGCIVKRITRWRDKGGTEDLLKIKHEVDLLIELERRSGNRVVRSS